MHILEVISSVPRSSKCINIVGGCGFRPRPHWELTELPDPPVEFNRAYFKALLLKERRRGEGREEGRHDCYTRYTCETACSIWTLAQGVCGRNWTNSCLLNWKLLAFPATVPVWSQCVLGGLKTETRSFETETETLITLLPDWRQCQIRQLRMIYEFVENADERSSKLDEY